MAEPEQPLLNIVGESVALGPRRRDLLPVFVRWLNDFEVTRTLAVGMHPMTLESEERWYETSAHERYGFVIYALDPLRPIGTVGLHDVDYKNGTAEFGIMIGEKSDWGKGYGSEAARLLLDYAFTGLGLNNVMLRTYGCNRRALGAYRRAGFREFGRRRQAIRIGRTAYDIVYMDCLAAEFEPGPVRRFVELDGDGADGEAAE